MNDWLPRVADLVDIMIDYWKDLVPMKSKDGGRGAILFRCIHALMSRQVRGLIERSLEHLYKTLDVYKVRTAGVFVGCPSFTVFLFNRKEMKSAHTT